MLGKLGHQSTFAITNFRETFVKALQLFQNRLQTVRETLMSVLIALHCSILLNPPINNIETSWGIIMLYYSKEYKSPTVSVLSNTIIIIIGSEINENIYTTYNVF